MTKTYYHATPYHNLESILEGGLQAGWDGFVYLTETPEDATKFVTIRGWDDILVVAVDLEDSLVDESFDHNENFFKCKAYIYPDDIPVHGISDYLRYQR